MSKNTINSIEIKNTSYDICSIDEIIVEILKIDIIGKVNHIQYNGLSDGPFKESKYHANSFDIQRFFETLESEIRVRSWNDDYTVEVCDGWAWECKINFSDKTIKKVIGTVEPPPRGDQFKHQIYNLVNFEVKPWIL